MNADSNWRSIAIAIAVMVGATMGLARYRLLIEEPEDARRASVFALLVGLLPHWLRIVGRTPEKGRKGGPTGRQGRLLPLVSALGHFSAGVGDLMAALRDKNK